MNRPRLDRPSATQSNLELSSSAKIQAPITLFAIPKAFDGHTGVIQRNALKSWCQLSPVVEVVLVGDEPGVAEIAVEFGLHHVPAIRRNSKGTPLVSCAFESVHAMSDSNVFVYCNCDVILLKEFTIAIERLLESTALSEFLAIGRRTDLDIEHEIDFGCESAVSNLRDRVASHGEQVAVVCKEYFAFTSNLFQDVPDFAVGRGNWDNWMVATARKKGVPVVSLSKQVPAIHQKHGYRSTTQRSRLDCYLRGEEAKQNQRLAGGRHLISGSSSTWTLDGEKVRKNRFEWLYTDFWTDTLPFLRLVLDLLISRR